MVIVVMVTVVTRKALPVLSTDKLLEACQEDFARRQTVFTEGQLVGVATRIVMVTMYLYIVGVAI